MPCRRSHPSPAPDFEAIKVRQQATWASGDFGRIGVTLQIVGESLCEAVDLRGGENVLDVAAGNGNASLAAARRFADVTSTDYVPELLEQGLRRAEAEGLPMVTRVADAEEPAVRRRRVRRRAVDLRRHVRARPGARGGRAAARRAPRRPHRARQLDARGLHRRAVPGRRALRAAAGRPRPAGAWGTETRLVELFGPHAQRHPHRAQEVRVPLPLGRALDRRVPHVLRADSQGVPRARRRPVSAHCTRRWSI